MEQGFSCLLHGSHLLLFIVHDGQYFFVFNFASNENNITVFFLQVQLMVTDSDLSDQFSLDTVGSHGFVKCKSHKKEYQVSSVP